MPRKTLEQEIRQISEDMLVLGKMVGNALIASVTALKNHDMELSRLMREEDVGICASSLHL